LSLIGITLCNLVADDLAYASVETITGIRLYVIKPLNLAESLLDPVVVSLTAKIQLSAVVVQRPQRRLGNSSILGDRPLTLTTSDASESLTGVEVLLGVDPQVAILNPESARWPTGPFPSLLGSPNTRFNPL